MALRPLSDLGLSDPTDLTRTSIDPAAAAPESPAPEGPPGPAAAPVDPTSDATPARTHDADAFKNALQDRMARGGAREPRSSGRRRPSRTPAKAPANPAPGGVSLGEEPTTFVQFFVAEAMHDRLYDASHQLALAHRKVRHHKTIMGALVWTHIDPDNAESLADLGDTLDQYSASDLPDASAERKIAAHLPYSLKWKLDGASLKLKRTRRDATAKALMNALLLRYVDPAAVDELVPTLEAFRAAMAPRPLPLTRGNADASFAASS